MLCYSSIIEDDKCNYRFTTFYSFTTPKCVCWTRQVWPIRISIQHFLGSSSLSPSEWCWHHWLHHIQYSPTSGGEAQNISNSSSQLLCGQESGGPYRCLMAGSLFIPSQTYTFQVAARNSNGVGPFSDPVITALFTQGIGCSYVTLSVNTSMS